MSVPIPSSNDICNGISAYSRISNMVNRLEILIDYLQLCQQVAADTDSPSSVSIRGTFLMLEDVFRDSCEIQRLLKPFSAYIR